MNTTMNETIDDDHINIGIIEDQEPCVYIPIIENKGVKSVVKVAGVGVTGVGGGKGLVVDENWSGDNLETLSQWIQISTLQIEVLDLAIRHYRSIVRKNVLLGLIFSTASGSISLSQMNSREQRFFFNIIFTILSFTVAILTGLIKIYQIQERLEEFIQLKQEWVGFSVIITTEVQLPVNERKRALELITKHKNKYLDLLKHDVDIPSYIKSRAYKNLYHDKHHYLDNLKKYKKLKEIHSCTDDQYFLREIELFEKKEKKKENKENKDDEEKWWMFLCIQYKQVYNYITNHKDKYIGEKTALSNIFLTVIMEEEDEQLNTKIVELWNNIGRRKSDLKTKLKEYNMYVSSKNNLEFDGNIVL